MALSHGSNDALYENFLCAIYLVAEGKRFEALDTVESVLRRAIRDLGAAATLPPFPAAAFTPTPILLAKPLLDVLAGQTVAEAGGLLVRVRSVIARNVAALSGSPPPLLQPDRGDRTGEVAVDPKHETKSLPPDGRDRLAER